MSSIAQAPVPVPGRAWWREPYVWLVIGGPLAVVIAGFATLAIALAYPDPVLERNPVQASTHTPADGDALTLAPAQQARNHAATATLPAKR